jgi:hypothetical protein
MTLIETLAMVCLRINKQGNYYLRAETHGKIIRRILRTDNLRITEIKQDSIWPCFRASLRDPQQQRGS